MLVINTKDMQFWKFALNENILNTLAEDILSCIIIPNIIVNSFYVNHMFSFAVALKLFLMTSNE